MALVWLCQGCGGEGPTRDEVYGATPETDRRFVAMPLTHRPERFAAIGPDACRSCHPQEVADWERSDHAHANRPASSDFVEAFAQEGFVTEGSEVYETRVENDRLLVEVVRGTGERTPYVAEGILGRTPLWQALVPFPGGRWQTTTLAFDPNEEEWYDVFAGEGRQAGEWGHWTGQGMNWNANCAYCHMTEFNKNLNVMERSYASEWTAHGISCVECHAGAAEHAAAARAGRPQEGLQSLDIEQVVMNCATCHSRRAELTAEAFLPGDDFHQHFDLSLPDQPNLYYADGQILDEVFVYASFRMSRMAHAGVNCRDCHNSHSGELILPAENNLLCLRCHSQGVENAPVINATAHSHHSRESTGNRCVECHMPHTTYMGRDARRDHGWHSPDPLMTRELGIPNACQNCHAEEGLDWQIEHAEAWYGEALAASRQRQRAQAIQAAYDGEAEAAKDLLALVRDEEIEAWRATYTGLLSNYSREAVVAAYLREAARDESPMVRERAITALGTSANAEAALRQALTDEYRNVRLSGAFGLQQIGAEIGDSAVLEEYQTYLEFNADRPTPALLLAEKALRAGDRERFERLVASAVALDPMNPELLRHAAVMSSMAGDLPRAAQYLQEGLKHAPDNAALRYSLALIYAETGSLPEAIEALRRTVELEPEFARAWYNLSIALYQSGDREGARDALQRAAPQLQGNPGFEQMKTLLGL